MMMGLVILMRRSDDDGEGETSDGVGDNDGNDSDRSLKMTGGCDGDGE